MAVPVMDPIEQERQFGFAYPPLPPRGIDPNIDRALDMVATGVEPAIIRELDSWTGQTHFAYSTPGTMDTSNRNMWILMDGRYQWSNQDGALSDSAPTWAPPKPDVEGGQYDLVRPVSVQYPGGSQPVVLSTPQYAPAGYGITSDFRFDPNTGKFIPVRMPDTPRAGVTNTTAPAGSLTAAETTGNVAGGNTMDEQVQSAGSASTGRTELSWDEWGFYWRQIYGEAAPAPEDLGYERAADGTVLIGGKARYTFAAWKAAAFGAPVAGAGSGAGSETPSNIRPGVGMNTTDYVSAFLAGLIAGSSGWHKFETRTAA